MAYNYQRYAIVCPHLQLFNHKIKGTLSFKQQRWCLCQRQVCLNDHLPEINDLRRLNMYQFCILYFIIITLIKIIIIAMFTICIIFVYV